MLERPNISDNAIINCLADNYEIDVHNITFLPLGADFDTAVFHVTTQDNTPYFFKLRSGDFDEASVRLPQFLYEQGISQIIPILQTLTGSLWGRLEEFKTILYPFIEGTNGYEVNLTETQWHEFGTALREIHATQFPAEIRNLIRTETYPNQAWEVVGQFLIETQNKTYEDAIAQEVAELIQTERERISNLITRTETLAQELREHPPKMIVCHTDLHAGNLNITPSGELYIVDWDQPLLAPKERDLMYIGGGMMASGLTPAEEEALFYETYGCIQLNHTSNAYYRYERIIQDIYEYCKMFFINDDGGEEDRAQSLIYLKSNFLPNGTIDIAYQTDKTQMR